MIFLEYYLRELESQLSIQSKEEEKPGAIKKGLGAVGNVLKNTGRKFESGIVVGMKRFGGKGGAVAAAMYPQAKELAKMTIEERKEKKQQKKEQEQDGSQ